MTAKLRKTDLMRAAELAKWELLVRQSFFVGGYPRGKGLYYRCRKCGDAIASVPADNMGCSCDNLFIDVDYHRLAAEQGSIDLVELIAPAR